MLAKCAARHPAKDAAKFRRNFVRVGLPSRKFHRNSTANFTAIKSRHTKYSRTQTVSCETGVGLGDLVVLTSQSPLRMLRSHSHYCSGLYQSLLAIVDLLCKFLAAVFVHVLKTLAAAIRLYGSCPPRINHSDCSTHLQRKKLAQNSTHQLREAPVTT